MSFYSSADVSTKYIDPKSFVDGARAVFETSTNKKYVIVINMLVACVIAFEKL